MKGPLKLLCYVKGGYLSNRAQTKKILQFVETAFLSGSQNMAQPMLPTSSFIPLSFLQTQRKPMTTLYSQNLVWLLLFNLLFPPTIMTLPTWFRSQPLIDYAALVTIQEMIHSTIRSHVATTMHEALLINCLNSNL